MPAELPLVTSAVGVGLFPVPGDVLPPGDAASPVAKAHWTMGVPLTVIVAASEVRVPAVVLNTASYWLLVVPSLAVRVR